MIAIPDKRKATGAEGEENKLKRGEDMKLSRTFGRRSVLNTATVPHPWLPNSARQGCGRETVTVFG